MSSKTMGWSFWVYEDNRHPTIGLNAVAGKPNQHWAQDPANYADMIEGCYNPRARAVDMLATE